MGSDLFDNLSKAFSEHKIDAGTGFWANKKRELVTGIDPSQRSNWNNSGKDTRP